MKCKNCELKEGTKYSKYSTGDFCCRECAKEFSTKEKRKKINNAVSKKLKGRGHGNVEKKCPSCDKKFNVCWAHRKQKNCSVECANKNRTKRKGSNKTEKNCERCDKHFVVFGNKKTTLRQRFCGKSCASSHNGKIGGLKSVISQNRRSKNEIYFGDFCKQKFKEVKFNTSMFNGWDADIIIEDLKIAVLWNGKWHYEKITEKHSVEQVQNRDKIKLKEIENAGYKSYVVKDMGKCNKKFVETQFEFFLKYCGKIVGNLQAS